jgi:hypothetical protein
MPLACRLRAPAVQASSVVGDRSSVGGDRVHFPLGERTEAAPHVADVREVDVPIDHVGDVVADGLSSKVVGHPAERIERRAFGAEQGERILVGEGTVGGRLRQRDPDLHLEALGVHISLRPVAGDLECIEVAVDRHRVVAQARVGGLGEQQVDRPGLPPDVRSCRRARAPVPRRPARRGRATRRPARASSMRGTDRGGTRTGRRS